MNWMKKCITNANCKKLNIKNNMKTSVTKKTANQKTKKKMTANQKTKKKMTAN